MIALLSLLGALAIVGGGLVYFVHNAFQGQHEAGYREAEKVCVAQIAATTHIAEKRLNDALSIQGEVVAGAHDRIAEAMRVADAAHRALDGERDLHGETRGALEDEQAAHAETRANMCHAGCTVNVPHAE